MPRNKVISVGNYFLHVSVHRLLRIVVAAVTKHLIFSVIFECRKRFIKAGAAIPKVQHEILGPAYHSSLLVLASIVLRFFYGKIVSSCRRVKRIMSYVIMNYLQRYFVEQFVLCETVFFYNEVNDMVNRAFSLVLLEELTSCTTITTSQ